MPLSCLCLAGKFRHTLTETILLELLISGRLNLGTMIPGSKGGHLPESPTRPVHRPRYRICARVRVESGEISGIGPQVGGKGSCPNIAETDSRSPGRWSDQSR